MTITLVCCLSLLLQGSPQTQEFTVQSAKVLRLSDVRKAIGRIDNSRRSTASQQFRLEWKAAKTPPETARAENAERQERLAPDGEIAVLSHRQRAEGLPRQRSMELGEGQLLLLGLDEAGHVRFWSVIPDPRIIRAEFPGPGGELQGRTLERSQVTFLVDAPGDPLIRELRFYKPVPGSDGDFDLQLMGTLTVPAGSGTPVGGEIR